MASATRDGYIIDFISGLEIKATPEEIDAVQVFAKQLVEDYNYPKSHIQTRPQFRVKVRPSDIRKEYPVDIAVFANDKRQSSDVEIIVECKKKTRRDGKHQLQDYLRLSDAYLGVWFNGNERLFVRKVERSGRVEFEEIPNIPQYGQRVEDIGKFTRRDLQPTHNLKATFKAIRNHLAANTVGTTRDEVLAQQMINLIFCKIYDEKNTRPDDIVSFRVGIDEDIGDVKRRIVTLFGKVKQSYKDVLDASDEIKLDDKSVAYVVGELQNYCLTEAERDVVADAFETFIGHALKGGLGQFFTPRNVVKMMVEILNPNDKDLIIDPACGSGGFLIEALRHVWQKMDAKAQDYGWSREELIRTKQKIATENFRGIDKDTLLAKVTKAYMTLIGDGTSGIVCDDSLETSANWNELTKQKISHGKFDVLLTNPPFGSKIPVRGEDKLEQFELGHRWTRDKKTGELQKSSLKDKEAPQILFIERCLQLLKDGGRMAIVLPDGIYGNNQLSYIRNWLLNNGQILAIIDVPSETFLPHTSTKTSILVFKKLSPSNIPMDYSIFMAVAETCGHDRRGKLTESDDIAEISSTFFELKKAPNSLNAQNKGAYLVKLSEFVGHDLWTPAFLHPIYIDALLNIQERWRTIQLGEIATIKKGDEVGSKNYNDYLTKEDTDIPFIRTSDISNYEINQFPDCYVSQQIYENLNQDLQAGDILFTKDGKIGMVAMVTESDKAIIGSGIVRLRLKAEAKMYNLTSEYLFAVLSSKEAGLYPALRRTVIASTIPHLRVERLGEIEIPILSKNSIDRITNLVKETFRLKNENKRRITEVRQELDSSFDV